ncbi:LysR family transcriptional regulator [Heyndrickxia shackletonii]|uniref:LysR family transcriptional regulator n=1 Tax=Heyndrickxia shackletonii TaxID=157838 RepID=A0A0Q3WVA9_9BACI|nr:LysR family transcriptional regulator [Heyndrickxia shackletonii]KQL52906.1 LysR family transcriptional regulator [Heyndrickxia shackletonii]NEY98914.1 LysR family transcriptional regulator [Heyndrickxia shackletonii]
MDLREIKLFIEVADHMSFTKAAEHSYLSQPSLSKIVKKLEEELQVELFDRSTRHLRLTDAGKIVYQQGRKALAPLYELNILLDELRDLETGEIKIGIPPLIGTLFFPDIARKFHAKYPKVKLQLVELGAKRIAELVEDAQIDLGIIVLPADEEKFKVYPYITDEFVLFIYEEHPLSNRKEVLLTELKDERFVLFSEDFTLHDYVKKACNEVGFEANVSYESSQWDLLVELVSSKMGIALLPKSIFYKQNHPNVKMIPIKEPTLLWKLGIITKKDAYHSFSLNQLLSILN